MMNDKDRRRSQPDRSDYGDGFDGFTSSTSKKWWRLPNFKDPDDHLRIHVPPTTLSNWSMYPTQVAGYGTWQIDTGTLDTGNPGCLAGRQVICLKRDGP